MMLRKLLAPCAMLLLCASAHAKESLFFRMGGEAKLRPAVEQLVEIMLEDQYASRQHAEVRRIESAYQVHDLHSKNGVLVDGAARTVVITGSTILSNTLNGVLATDGAQQVKITNTLFSRALMSAFTPRPTPAKTSPNTAPTT